MHDGRERWSAENEAFWRGLGGSENFRFLGFTRLGTGAVLYIAPSKNIKKFSQSDHGNINFEVVKVSLSPAQFGAPSTAAAVHHQDGPKRAGFLLS